MIMLTNGTVYFKLHFQYSTTFYEGMFQAMDFNMLSVYALPPWGNVEQCRQVANAGIVS